MIEPEEREPILGVAGGMSRNAKVFWISLLVAVVLLAGIGVIYYLKTSDVRASAQNRMRQIEKLRLEVEEHNAHVVFKLAYVKLKDGNPRFALAMVDEAIGEYGARVHLLALKAEALRELGRSAEAHAAFAEAGKLEKPCSFLVVVESGFILEAGSPDKAERILRKVLDEDPACTDARIALGRLLARRGDPEKAISVFDEALELDNAAWEACFERGLAFLQMEQYEDAARNFALVAANAGSNRRTYLMLALCQAALGNHAEALFQYDYACMFESAFPWVYTLRAASEIKLADYLHARENADQALVLDDNIGLACAVRAEVNFLEGDFKAACADADRAIELGPGAVTSLWYDPLAGAKKQYPPAWVREWFELARYRRAVAAYELGDMDDAVRRLRQVKDAPPDMRVPEYYLGLACAAKKDYKEALSAFAAALRKQPGNADPFFRRAKIFVLKGEEAAALRELEKLVSADPTHEPGRALRAKLLFRSEDKKALALRAYTGLVKTAPANPEYRLMRGRLLAEFGRLDLALGDLERAVQFDPVNPESRYFRALVLFLLHEKQGEKTLPRAYNDVESAIAGGMAVVESFLLRARINFAMGEWKDALADFVEVRARGAKDADIPLHIGMAAIKLGDLATAKRELSTFKGDSRALNLLADVALREDDPERAIELFSKSIKVDPRQATTYFLRGKVFLKQKETDNALSDFSAAIEIDPKFADALFERAEIFLARRDGEKAAEDYTLLLDVDPGSARALAGRGRAYFYRKEYKKAIADWKKALSIDPDIPNIKAYIAAAKAKLEKK